MTTTPLNGVSLQSNCAALGRLAWHFRDLAPRMDEAADGAGGKMACLTLQLGRGDVLTFYVDGSWLREQYPDHRRDNNG